MLLMLLIGWTILLPAIVVAGLYVTSSVLGRRRAARHGYEDLFLERESSEVPFATSEVPFATEPVGPDATPSVRRPVGVNH